MGRASARKEGEMNERQGRAIARLIYVIAAGILFGWCLRFSYEFGKRAADKWYAVRERSGDCTFISGKPEIRCNDWQLIKPRSQEWVICPICFGDNERHTPEEYAKRMKTLDCIEVSK